jgi:hypothetical protein
MRSHPPSRFHDLEYYRPFDHRQNAVRQRWVRPYRFVGSVLMLLAVVGALLLCICFTQVGGGDDWASGSLWLAIVGISCVMLGVPGIGLFCTQVIVADDPSDNRRIIGRG